MIRTALATALGAALVLVAPLPVEAHHSGVMFEEQKEVTLEGVVKDHRHMSSVFSPNTADDSVTGPILKWMQSVK